jgi:hypothetical protein
VAQAYVAPAAVASDIRPTLADRRDFQASSSGGWTAMGGPTLTVLRAQARRSNLPKPNVEKTVGSFSVILFRVESPVHTHERP